jgi:hypothetical protein
MAPSPGLPARTARSWSPGETQPETSHCIAVRLWRKRSEKHPRITVIKVEQGKIQGETTPSEAQIYIFAKALRR